MADLPAKQAQYVAYAEKDSKARNIAASIDSLTGDISDIDTDITRLTAAVEHADYYEYVCTAEEAGSLFHYLLDTTSDWSFQIGLDLEEAMQYHGIKIIASYTVYEQVVRAEAFLAELARLDVADTLVKVVYSTVDPVQVSSESAAFNIRIMPEVDGETGDTSIRLFGYPVNDKVTSADIDSETATVGQVLTADGAGGCLWQSSSPPTLYKHRITLTSNVDAVVIIELYNYYSSAYTSFAGLAAYLNAMGYTSGQSGIVGVAYAKDGTPQEYLPIYASVYALTSSTLNATYDSYMITLDTTDNKYKVTIVSRVISGFVVAPTDKVTPVY